MTVIPGPWPYDRGGIAPRADGQLLAGRVHAARAGLPTIGRGALPAAIIVDELAGLRWEDDGGPALDDGRPAVWPPIAWQQLGARLAELGRAIVTGMRRVLEAAGRAWQQIVEALTAWRSTRAGFRTADDMRARGRWHTDTEPTRWRDWQPSPERPVDRARRQRLERTARRIAARRGGAA